MAAGAGGGDKPEPETVERTLRALGPSRPTTLRLPPLLSVADLRRRIAHDRGLPEDRLRLVLRGRTLPCQADADADADAHVTFSHGDSLTVDVGLWHLNHLLIISVMMTTMKRMN